MRKLRRRFAQKFKKIYGLIWEHSGTGAAKFYQFKFIKEKMLAGVTLI